MTQGMDSMSAHQRPSSSRPRVMGIDSTVTVSINLLGFIMTPVECADWLPRSDEEGYLFLKHGLGHPHPLALLAAAEPARAAAEAIHVDVHHRGDIERQELRNHEPADHRQSQRTPRLATRPDS